MQKGGNDWPLAQAIRNRNNSKDRVYPVESWRETYEILLTAHHEDLWSTA